MKTLMFAIAATSALALSATPVVSDVVIEQRNSRTVKVTYNLSEDAVVTVDFLTNATAEVWASIGGKNVTHVWGDCNRLVKGAGPHTLYWAPEKSWGAQFADTFSVKAEVKAWAVDAPPNYMVVDLCAEKTIRYYESADSLPDGGVTNPIYKTDRLVMRKIPAKGVTWRMGSPTGEVGKKKSEDSWNGWETPHYVTLTEDFYLGVYELTRRQCIDRIPAGYYWNTEAVPYLEDDPMRPVAGNRYVGAMTYKVMRGITKLWPGDGHDVADDCALDRLRKKTGVDFDLPTEAQWEFACRAGTGSALYNGKELSADDGVNEGLEDIAWYKGNAGVRMHVVGELKPNAFGLYDMLGNVCEYCLDRISGRGDIVDEPVDPKGSTADTKYRIVRGGFYSGDAFYSRAATRQNYSSYENEESAIGFRLWAPAIAK